MSWFLAGLLLGSAVSAAEGADITPALDAVRHAKWDPKGGAIDPFARGDAKRKKEEWEPAIELLLASIEKQQGCGKCLNSLSLSLVGAERYADAARVGEHVATLFPERKEGPLRVSTAWLEARELEKSLDATNRFLQVELEKEDIPMWSRRNRLLLELGRVDEAETVLQGAVAAGLKESAVDCMRIQLLAATDQPGAARELWASCQEEEDIDLRRSSEGWLAMAEGDHELAATRLSVSGGNDFARLAIAQMRVDEKEYEAAVNITTKLVDEVDWAWDAYLVRAQALHGLGRDDEALAVLRAGPTAPGWQEVHRTVSLDHVLLKPRGKEWPKTVAERSLALEIAILAAQGHADQAKALRDEAVAVHGARRSFDEALAAAPAAAGP